MVIAMLVQSAEGVCGALLTYNENYFQVHFA